MKALEQKILNEGKILPGNVLKVNGFLNHQIDVPFLMQMGKEVAEKFKNSNITKVLTIEASGIAFATCIASYLKVPVLFAKKNKSSNIAGGVYQSQVFSYTHNVSNYIVVEKQFLNKNDVCLIADDFLASGNAVLGLEDIINQSGATLKGVAIAVEKGFQDGGKILRDKGMDVYSLAIVDEMSIEKGIKFRAQ